MPNWCFTDYMLIGSAEDTKAAYDALHKVEETKRHGPFATWSFESNPNWLGYTWRKMSLVYPGALSRAVVPLTICA